MPESKRTASGVLGGIAGWIASKIMGTDKDMGIIKNVLAGVIGGNTYVTEPAMAMSDL